MPHARSTPRRSHEPLRLVVTGGGTGGHVIPALAVIREIQKRAPHAEIHYIGAAHSIEESLVKKAGLPFHTVTVGKLRRYFSLENIIDALRVPLGVIQAVRLLRQLKPAAVFAKGGFVSVPTALAAGILKIPLILHESDATPGLATRLAMPFATRVCLSFPNAALTKRHSKFILTGNPVRPAGDAARGKKFLNFKTKQPIILVAGGSTGAEFLNGLVSTTFKEIAKFANVVVVTGADKKCKIQPFGKLRTKFKIENVRSYEFLGSEYLDVLAAADLVVSRAGANALAEIALARKPAIIVPLPTVGSRGDQLANAEIFAAKKAVILREQSILTPTNFVTLVHETLTDKRKRMTLATNIRTFARPDAAKKIAEVILAVAIKK